MSLPSEAPLPSAERRAAADTTNLGTVITRDLIKTATLHLTKNGGGPSPMLAFQPHQK